MDKSKIKKGKRNTFGVTQQKRVEQKTSTCLYNSNENKRLQLFTLTGMIL